MTMGMFSIALGGEDSDAAVCPEGHLGGRLRIGDFVEGFCSSLSFWSPEDYRHHWRRALSDIVAADVSSSALITNALDPRSATFLTWWPLYRSGDHVRIANALVPAGEYDLWRALEEPGMVVGSPEDLWGGPPEERASEWNTTVADVRRFLEA